MNSNKSLRIIVGGVLLVLAAAALRWALFKPDAPAAAEPVASIGQEQESPGTASRQRPGVRSQPATRTASTRATSARPANLPSPDAAKRLFVDWKGTWYAAEILTSANGSYYIRYSGYGQEWDEWVTPDRMRYSDPLEAPPQNQGTPPDSTVDLTVADRFKVYYDDDDRKSATTETLTYATTLLESAAPSDPQLDHSPVVQGRPSHGDLLVEWGKKWWPAEVVKQEGSSYFIHYKGYGTNWDEWVTFERLGIYSAAE